MNYPNNYQNDFETGLNQDSNQNQGSKDFSLAMRLGFIKKVYAILCAQLLLTVILSLVSMTSLGFQNFQKEHTGILIFFLLLAVILPCVIICCQSTMREYPKNYIILFVFTFSESWLVSFICAATNPKFVFMAAFMTFCMVVALSAYALTTKTDFTMQGGLYFILSTGLFMFAIFAMLSSNKIVHIIYCVIAIIVFGMYLIYDTQIILGNKENALEIDDYILGSFMLYTDIIALFLRILELIQLTLGGNNN